MKYKYGNKKLIACNLFAKSTSSALGDTAHPKISNCPAPGKYTTSPSCPNFIVHNLNLNLFILFLCKLEQMSYAAA